MSDIKVTIELVLRILYENRAIHNEVKSETFRAAKFNDHEALIPLWRLLYELISYCLCDRITDIVIPEDEQFISEASCLFIKRQLEVWGYHSPYFNRLPLNMSIESKEVLLAIGWLLLNKRIIERCLKSRDSQFSKDLRCAQKIAYLKTSSLSMPTKDENSESCHLRLENMNQWQHLQQLLSFNKKLQLSLYSLYITHSECNLLQHKMHKVTCEVDFSTHIRHLTMQHVLALRHPTQIKMIIDSLEQDNVKLRDLLEWKHKESIFWKWMESLLLLKVLSKVDYNHSDDASRNFLLMNELETVFNPNDVLFQLSPQGIQDCLSKSHQKLEDFILKYEITAEHFQGVSERDSNRDVAEQQTDAISSSISRQLCSQGDHLPHQRNVEQLKKTTDCLLSISSWSAIPEFILCNIKKRQNILNKNKYSHTEDTKRPAKHGLLTLNAPPSRGSLEFSTDSSDVENETSMLKSVIRSLEIEIGIQETLKADFESLSNQLQNVICIPPMQTQPLAKGTKTKTF